MAAARAAAGPSVDLSSGWVGGTWTIPQHRLDPGVTYSWAATIKDPAGATAAVTRTFWMLWPAHSTFHGGGAASRG